MWKPVLVAALLFSMMAACLLGRATQEEGWYAGTGVLYLASTILVAVFARRLVWARWTLAVLFAPVAAYGPWRFPSPLPPDPPGWAKQTASGTLGRYRVASDRQLKEFNSAARAWFVERGFVPDADTTFSKIVDAASLVPNANPGKEWEGHGVLLCRHFGTTGEAYVFIPDFYLPKSRLQLVGFHISLSGNSDEVLRRRHDFDATEAAFQARFPEDRSMFPQASPAASRQ